MTWSAGIGLVNRAAAITLRPPMCEPPAGGDWEAPPPSPTVEFPPRNTKVPCSVPSKLPVSSTWLPTAVAVTSKLSLPESR